MLRPLVSLPLALVLLTACEPLEPDHGEWRENAYYAVTDVASDVSTAHLVLRELLADHMAGNYAQVTLVAAEDEAGKSSQNLTKEQPPPTDTDRFDKVSSLLSDAQDLLTATRIAVVRRNDSSYPGLIRKLTAQEKALEDETSKLGGLRG